MFFFFFFQAEDGIRHGRVTGVQTCALPISGGVPATPTNDPEPAYGLASGVGRRIDLTSDVRAGRLWRSTTPWVSGTPRLYLRLRWESNTLFSTMICST